MEIRSDIEVKIRSASITILSKENQLTFSTSGETFNMFITSAFTIPMLDDLDKSGIVTVNGYNYDGTTGNVNMKKKFGFENEKFTELLIFLMEKYQIVTEDENKQTRS